MQIDTPVQGASLLPMIFTGTQAATATGGQLIRNSTCAGSIQTDSRRLSPGSWFLALRGERYDGHQFVAHALKAGCVGAIVEELPEPDPGIGGLIQVPDTLAALQSLASYARGFLSGPVVGITGSAGKTSTRVMVMEVLKSFGRVHATQGNLNNHIGLPLTLLSAPPDTNATVLELGMNHPGEIALLARIARPGIRLITNVGAAHIEGCGSIAGVAAAKQELFDAAQPGDILCINLDDEWIPKMPIPPETWPITYGTHTEARIRLVEASVDTSKLQTRIWIDTPDGEVRAVLPVVGTQLALNAAAATAVAFALRIPPAAIASGLERFVPEGMRNRIVSFGPHRIIEDAYNANPLSMRAALQTLKEFKSPRVAVLGDMLELGNLEEIAHQQLLQETEGVERVMLVGERLKLAAQTSSCTVEVFESHEAAAEALALFLRHEEAAGRATTVLLKGSRGARMERVLEVLRSAAVEEK